MSHSLHADDGNVTANDADDEKDGAGHRRRHLKPKKKQIPMLLFIPTNELITNTFRLANIARDIGMDFHPSPSLSHLFFSWPSSSPPPSTSSSWSTCSLSPLSLSSLVPSNAVPLPFPGLSTSVISLSILRVFVSSSRGFFKLVFFNGGPEFEPMQSHNRPNVSLFARVSGRKVVSMDDLCRDLMGHGWCLFRTHKPYLNSVYLFMKKDVNRVRVRGEDGGGGGGCGKCRIRELRLPALDFGSEVPYRVLLYILLMTDDIFYLA